MSPASCAELLCSLLQVEFSPTLQTLASVVNDIGSHLFATISVFRHLPDILTKRKMNREPIYVLVGAWALGGGTQWAGYGERPNPFTLGLVVSMAGGNPSQGATEEGAGTGRRLEVT